MYRDLGFIRVWGKGSGDGVEYAYLDLPAQADRGLPAADRRRCSTSTASSSPTRPAVRQRPAARLRRRPRQVDGAHRRRAPPHPEREHAPPRPPGRPQAGPPGPLAPRAVGAASACGRPGARRKAVAASLEQRVDPKHRSRALTEGPARAAARAYLNGIGFDDEALSKPIIGVAHYVDRDDAVQLQPPRARRERQGGHPGGRRHADGAQHDRDLRRHDDGHAGMKTSLVSREVIADSIELVARGHLFDGIVCISGCDKTIPATVMALARLDVPGLMLYGGSIRPGTLPRRGRHDPGGLRGGRRARRRPDERRGARTSSSASASPGAGACGGQFTANTMAMAFEVIGHQPDGLEHGPGRGRHEGRGRARGGPARRRRPQARPAPERHHHQGQRSRTRSPRSRRAAARRTPSCTCSPSRARRASSSTSTTSTASPSARR